VINVKCNVAEYDSFFHPRTEIQVKRSQQLNEQNTLSFETPIKYIVGKSHEREHDVLQNY